MSPKAQLEQLAQDVYLVVKNRTYDDIQDEDGQKYVSNIARWATMWIDELEGELDIDDQPVDWKWERQDAYELGAAVEGGYSITTPTEVHFLLAEEGRYVQILQDGSPVSNWAVVEPKQITNKSDRITEDMCAQIGGSIVFSRTFRDTEQGGIIVGDVSIGLPAIVGKIEDGIYKPTNVKLISLVTPYTLLVLGIAKNTTLPDIVQGKLTPNYQSKYNRLLKGAIARNRKTSLSSKVEMEDFSHVRGV